MKEELLNYLKSPVWWATVIFASFVVNLVSSYSKDAIDRFIPRLFEWQRIRNTHRQEAINEAAESEANNVEKRTYLRLLQIRHFQNFTLYLLLGCGALMVGITLPILLGALPLICAGWSMIWLKFVKRTVVLLSESFHFFFRLFLHRLLDRVRDRNTLTAVINAEIRESTPDSRRGVINRTRSDAASFLV
jgi:hypothetical protein